ncbi:myb-related transcription factor, partner of profilin, partial [Plakobranchus ocellatus]
KRVRKPNFSEKEATKLLELVDRNIEKINQTANSLRANTVKKKAAWQEIAKEVSSTSVVHRDEDECRKKWRDLKRAVSAYRTHFRGTGGGPPQPEPPFYEWILKILGDSVALEGIPVGFASFTPLKEPITSDRVSPPEEDTAQSPPAPGPIEPLPMEPSTSAAMAKNIARAFSKSRIRKRGDSKLVATFQLHLSDEARWWFDDLPSNLRGLWAKMKDAFQLRFVQRTRQICPISFIRRICFSRCSSPPISPSIVFFLIPSKKKS